MIDIVKEDEVVQWQAATRREVLLSRALTNCWGRMIDFTYERLSEDLFRRSYAFRPQSELSDLLNQYGFIPAARYLRETGYGRINLHEHDSLVMSVKPEHAYDVACFVRKSLERPVRYSGIELMIPIEVKVGKSWGGMHEWKKFPSRKEFEEVAFA